MPHHKVTLQYAPRINLRRFCATTSRDAISSMTHRRRRRRREFPEAAHKQTNIQITQSSNRARTSVANLSAINYALAAGVNVCNWARRRRRRRMRLGVDFVPGPCRVREGSARPLRRRGARANLLMPAVFLRGIRLRRTRKDCRIFTAPRLVNVITSIFALARALHPEPEADGPPLFDDDAAAAQSNL